MCWGRHGFGASASQHLAAEQRRTCPNSGKPITEVRNRTEVPPRFGSLVRRVASVRDCVRVAASGTWVASGLRPDPASALRRASTRRNFDCVRNQRPGCVRELCSKYSSVRGNCKFSLERVPASGQRPPVASVRDRATGRTKLARRGRARGAGPGPQSLCCRRQSPRRPRCA